MKQPIFMAPVLQEKIWGGTKLRDIYHYEIPSEKTGECWAISAHPNGMGHVLPENEFAGMSLAELFTTHPELFGNPQVDVFPLLTKIIDAADDLSVQVHPDDAYGLAHEGELGKTECWYVIDADPGSKIVYGHTAQTREELAQRIHDGEWSELLEEVEVKAGDFFFVPSGTIHAIGAGVTILETQQSSDTTYRVYDYDRKDDQGNERELHIQQSIDVTTVPHEVAPFEQTVEKIGESELKTLITSDYFNVFHWTIDSPVSLEQVNKYTLVSVLEGEGMIKIEDKEWPLAKGQHFIIPATVTSWELSGKLDIIASTPGVKNN
ncbi:mannose-6-phosphate isomerase, class I [Vagococcus xieshaowenii]|uniref:Mannose-6-phosphate isomerase n=1 Tax=Vagococcus xieshaowenii TaxID=2562451 RepID=A0AAJ5JLC3_9ENTE|nr:mannose-6-phosphate isomerase, class I [Vagococcus xieshaowenii]QCA29624.1 mannose-6-phosphate isomerase, class I [Vagococcus xieshaowenii]TFZ39373.1 mannose-6-phosphate isomerase, class I [Vagococcus xieshaowenii]